MDADGCDSSGAGKSSTQCLVDVFLYDGDPDHAVLLQLMHDHLLLSTYGAGVLETLPFSNIVGAQALADESSRAAVLEIFVYRKTNGPRVRHCMKLSLDSRGEKNANFQTCQRWSRAIQCRARGVDLEFVNGDLVIPESHGRRFLIYCNPFSGTGKGEMLLNSVVLPMLADGGCSFEVVRSQEKDHVWHHIRAADLSSIDCIMIISGDGLLFEVVNGMMERADQEKAFQIPLAIIPSGSGNAVSASILYQTKEFNDPSNSAFICVKGEPVELDLMEITGSGKRVFSILSIEYGLLAEIDIASEAFRHLGPARFTLGFVQQLIKHQVFPSRFSYLPAREDSSCPCGKTAEQCTCLPPLQSDKQLSDDWVVCEKDFIFLQPTLQTHLTDSSQFRHQDGLCDGHIHLVVATSQCSRTSIVQMFLEMGNLKGKIDEYDGVSDISALAFRIEPLEATLSSGPHHLAVDGEEYPFGPIQGRVHPGKARIIGRLR